MSDNTWNIIEERRKCSEKVLKASMIQQTKKHKIHTKTRIKRLISAAKTTWNNLN